MLLSIPVLEVRASWFKSAIKCRGQPHKTAKILIHYIKCSNNSIIRCKRLERLLKLWRKFERTVSAEKLAVLRSLTSPVSVVR